MSAKPPTTRPHTYAPGTQLIHDKTSYGLIPTHPSPGLMSPSNSTSNSSSSPPEPPTPPRISRSRTRYSDLSRVPLHRRGTSKTYERLEDLLKEAGYKETRVFTPETERSETGDDPRGNQENRSNVRDGMDAVVGFFAGLLPGAMSSRISLEPPESASSGPAQLTTSLQDYSPPVSPLTNRTLPRQVIGGKYDLTEPPTPTTINSSMESLGEPTPRPNYYHDPRINHSASIVNPHAPRTYHSQRPPLPHHTSSQLFHTSQQMQKQSSRSSLHHQAIQYHSNIVSPRPSRASAYMRQITSTSMPPRPNSTPAHISKPAIFVNDSDINSTHTLHVKSYGEDSDQPPLPPSWLRSVARAVLFGGTGAYIGGPSNFISHQSPRNVSSPRSVKAQVLRNTRSSLSQVPSRRSKYHRQSTSGRSGLSDQTNTPASGCRSAFLVPPPLLSQIERGRSRKSEGEVSRTRVVCRSAPGSRNGSVTRNDDGKERWRKRDKKSRKKEEKGRLPSLARTQAEGDVWDRGKNEPRTRGTDGDTNRYLNGWSADIDSEAVPCTSSEEEDDGELDLARILVPPKRQNSIKSLRKHLASEAGSGPSAHPSLKNYAARAGSTGRSAGRGMNVIVGGGGGDGSGRKTNRGPNVLQRRWTEEDWDGESHEEWGGGWVRRKGAGNRESEDDDVDSFVGFLGEGRTSLVGTSKGGNRLGWVLMGGNGS